MTLKLILKHPNDQLLKVSEPLSDEDIKSDSTQRLIDDMLLTMNTEKGIGLAAPQVGVHKRLFVLDLGDGPIVLINPKIISRSTRMIETTEGCLSIPGVWGVVARHKSVKLKAKNRKGEPIRVKASGLFSVVCQHENDHLDGILFIDRADRILEGEEMLEGAEAII
ncbi:MAG: peptide deformylase [Candidatus Uhrbacteria bacterium]|nr:peptide deformylase [Candidatus Uhrbacteria bacterium]